MLIIFSFKSACEFHSDDYLVVDDLNDGEKGLGPEDSHEIQEFENMIAKKLKILKNYMRTPQDLLNLKKKA